MKTISDDLYRLIHSLDKSEKGYFRKFASKTVLEETRNYIKLFNEIDRQVTSGKEYDEKQIRDKFKDEKFIHQLSTTKAYLYDMILKVLSTYDSGKFVIQQINDLMDNIVVLFRRGLYSQSLKLIKRAKKIAYKNDQYLKLYDILRYEKNVYTRLEVKNFPELLRGIFSEQIRILEVARNLTEYASIYNDAYGTLDEYGLFKNTKDEKKFDSVMKNELMSSDTFALSFGAKLYFFGVTYAYYIAKSDFENAYYCVKKLVDIQNSKAEFKKNSPFSHYIEYLNVIDPAIYLGKNAEVVELLSYIEKVTEDKKSNLSRSNKAYFRGRIFSTKLMFYVRNWKPEQVNELIEKLGREKELKDQLSRHDLTVTYYFISLYYFIKNEIETSLKWLNKIDLDTRNDYQLNYYSSIPILKILIQYELGNYDSIEYLVQSLNRNLNKTKKFYELESEFLKTIKKLANTIEKGKETEILASFQKNISGFTKNTMFFNLDLISWSESKIKNKSFSEILRQKHA